MTRPHRHAWQVHSVTPHEDHYSTISLSGVAHQTIVLYRCRKCRKQTTTLHAGTWTLQDMADSQP